MQFAGPIVKSARRGQVEMLTPLKSLKETCWISLEIVPDPPREQPGSLQKNSWKSGREVEKAVLPALSDD